MINKDSLVVCHVTRAHGRYDTRIFYKECRSLVGAGYQVYLAVCDELPDEQVDGVNIVSIGYRPQTNRKLKRLIITLSKLKHMLKKIDADLYHFHDPELLVMALYFKRQGKKVVFDSHEDVPAQLRGSKGGGKYQRIFFSTVYEKYERRVAKKIDSIISVTPRVVDRFKSINGNSVLVTNYPIIDVVDPGVALTRDKTLCFAGGIASHYRHKEILDAMQGIIDVRYILAGRSSESYLSELKKLPAWQRVEYRGVIQHSEVKNLYRDGRIGLAIHRSAQGGSTGSFGVNKLFEYMAAGLPVICSDNTIWKQIIEEEDCGVVVNPDDVNEIRDAIIYLLDDYDLCVRMGQNGKSASNKKYNWRLQEQVLFTLYEKLLSVNVTDSYV